MNEWKIIKLAKCGDWLSGGTPSKSNPDFWNGDIPWISAKSMYLTRISDSEDRISKQGAQNGTRLVPPKSILILVRGSMLHQRIPLGITTREVAFNQDVKAVLPYKNLILPEFLLYWLLAHESVLLGMVESTSIGAGKFSTDMLMNLDVLLPPINAQKEIIELFCAIDDKIELNRSMNTTLEATARALFQSWFVDFDPVHAKARGEQPFGMDAATATLFPDHFEDSPLGPIPTGWQVETLGNRIQVKHGYAFQGEYFETEPTQDILLTPGNFAIGGGFKEGKSKYYLGPVPEEYVLTEDDLLITMTDLSKAGDTLGYPALVPLIEEKRLLHNQRLGKVITKNQSYISKLFLYFLLRTNNYRQHILGSATGSTVKHTSPSRIESFQFVQPPINILKVFEESSLTLYSAMKLNDKNSRILAEIRDVLLPKLVSGDVRVAHVNNYIQDIS